MMIEVALLMSGVSVAFGIFFGLKASKRSERLDAQSEAVSLTTVMVKLESISTQLSELKAEISNAKGDIRENRERIIIVEEAVKQAHRRLDHCGKSCKATAIIHGLE